MRKSNCEFVRVNFFLRDSSGFTLLELLTVISIISFIANVAIAVSTTAREKARIAGGLQFSQSVQQSFGATEEVRWTFESINASNEIVDESGNGYHGVFYQGDPAPSGSNPITPIINSTDSLIGNYASFNGANQYVAQRISSAVIANVPFTVSLWVRAVGDPTGAADTIFNSMKGNQNSFHIMFLRNGQNSVNCDVNRNQFSFRIHNQTNKRIDICFGGSGTEWHHIVASFNLNNPSVGNNIITLYMDGQQMISSSYSNADFHGEYFGYRLGAYGGPNPLYHNGSNFTGDIDEFHFYRQALSVAQIKKLYADGLEKLKLTER